MNGKKKIYYARTYRRLELNFKSGILFACLMIIPTVLFLVFFTERITEVMTYLATLVLSKVIPAEDILVKTTQYSIVCDMKYIELPTTQPGIALICGNLIVCLLALILFRIFKKAGRPLAVFATFSIMIHIVSCAFFAFAGKYFPYTVGDYSELYMKQQVGIWLTFAVLAGLVVAFMGGGRYGVKLLTFSSIIIYSVIFGTIRYILFLFVLHQFSVLYMALLFFVIGPTFDFSYFVVIYALFVNKTIKHYETGGRKDIWKWS